MNELISCDGFPWEDLSIFVRILVKQVRFFLCKFKGSHKFKLSYFSSLLYTKDPLNSKSIKILENEYNYQKKKKKLEQNCPKIVCTNFHVIQKQFSLIWLCNFHIIYPLFRHYNNIILILLFKTRIPNEWLMDFFIFLFFYKTLELSEWGEYFIDGSLL